MSGKGQSFKCKTLSYKGFSSDGACRPCGIALADATRVEKSGLVALADTYGFERSLQERFKQLAADLCEHTRVGLTDMVATSLRLTGVRQTQESFAAFCSKEGAPRILVCGQANHPSFALRLEPALRRMLVEATFGTSPAASSAVGDRPLTATETKVLDQMVTAAAGQALRLTLDGPEQAEGSFRVVASWDGDDRTSLDGFPPDESLLAIEGRLSLNGREGALALALPIKRIMQSSVNPDAMMVPENVADKGRHRARAALADALVTLTAVLGESALPLARIRGLVPGSLIPLGRIERGTPLITLRAEGQIIFSGTIVADRGWYRFVLQNREKSGEQSERRNAA